MYNDKLSRGWAAMPLTAKIQILHSISGELVSLNEAAQIVGYYSAMTVYRAAGAGELRTVKIGAYAYVLADELQRWYHMKRPHDNDRNIVYEVKQWKSSQ